jgi:hypothetical protein
VPEGSAEPDGNDCSHADQGRSDEPGPCPLADRVSDVLHAGWRARPVFHRTRRWQRLDRRDQPVTALSNRLDISRAVVTIVTQGTTQLIDREIHGPVADHRSLPDRLDQLVLGNDRALPACEADEQIHGTRLEPD